MSSNILLTGATGTVGGHLAAIFREREIQARLLVRSPDAASHLASPVSELVTADLSDKLSTAAALDGVKTAFLLTAAAPDSVEIQTRFIDAAASAGVEHLVKLSALGARADSPVQLARWHALIEEHLRKSTMSWTVLQPHSYMQNLLASAPAIQANDAFYGCSGEGAYSVIDARDVAAVAAVVLMNPASHGGKTYVLTGAEALTQADQARHVSRVVGRAIQYIDLPPEQFEAGMVEAGVPAWLAADLVSMQQFFATGSAAGVSTVSVDLTGSPATSFGSFAADHAAFFSVADQASENMAN